MTEQDALMPEPKPAKRFGPIYQGVAAEIRRLTAQGKWKDEEQLADPDIYAGTIAQARSLAASIDRVSGHEGGYQASGKMLAELHAELRALLEVLHPESTESDPFQDFINSLDEDEGSAPRGTTPAPHPEV